MNSDTSVKLRLHLDLLGDCSLALCIAIGSLAGVDCKTIMQLEGDILSRQKDAVVLGTYESNAFILSLRRRDEFSTTHSFGYHRVPHIGTSQHCCVWLPPRLLSVYATVRI